MIEAPGKSAKNETGTVSKKDDRILVLYSRDSEGAKKEVYPEIIRTGWEIQSSDVQYYVLPEKVFLDVQFHFFLVRT